jgi:DNA polymerase III subunit epsilon
MRQVILDIETTGLEISAGHRIIEVGCVELIDRRSTDHYYHRYLCPDREIEEGALAVHGITLESLKNSPRFGDIVEEFLEFVRGAELIIHNAPFDISFIDYELELLGPGWGKLRDHCTVLDTLVLARELHPGQKNSLDALCKRYRIDNSHRDLHGALLDAKLLAALYLVMTGGQQAELLLESNKTIAQTHTKRLSSQADRARLRVIIPTEHELAIHRQHLAEIDKVSRGHCIWRLLEEAADGDEGVSI